MEATFNLTIDILNNEFVEKLKAIFPNNSKVEIRITEISDETDYLLSTSENRDSLIKSIEQYKQGQIVSKSFEELAL